MDWLSELLEESKAKTLNVETNELTATLKEINRSLQRIANNLRDIKYKMDPLWK